MSDYEVRVLRELRKGIKNPEEISKKTGIPPDIVKVVLKTIDVECYAENRSQRVKFSRNSIDLAFDLLILYVAFELIKYIIWWFR